MGRMAMVAKNNPHNYENISELWNSEHAHLKPTIENVAESSSTFKVCPSCGQSHAVELIANLQLDNQDKWYKTIISYCMSCSEYTLSLKQKKILIQSNNIEIKAQPCKVTGIDARLWIRKPTLLNMEPTTRCNFECWYCIGRDMEQGDIEEENFSKAIANYPGLKVIALVGEGEPFLHKGFFNMAKQAIDKGIKLATITNGSTLSTSIVKKICETGIHYVSISIDSIHAEQFSGSRHKGNLKQVLNGIKRLKDYRDAQGYKYPKIGLKGTLFDYSKDQLPEITKKAIEQGIDVMEGFQALNKKENYIKIYPQEQLMQLQHVDEVQAEIDQAMAMVDSSEDFDIEMCGSYSDKEDMGLIGRGTYNTLRKNCDEHVLYSLYSGDITPCCQIKDKYSKKWNIFNHNVDTILTDQYYENIRFNLWNGFFLPECKGCFKT